VVSFSGVKPTATLRAGDKYCATYCLVDQSYSVLSHPVVFNLFSNHLEYFPNIIAVGDIFRINRVKGQIYDNKLQLVGNFLEGKQVSILTIHKRLNPVSGLLDSTNLQSLSSAVEYTSSPSKPSSHVGLDSNIWLVDESRRQNFSFHPSESHTIEGLHTWGQTLLSAENLRTDAIDAKLVNTRDLYLNQQRLVVPISDTSWTRCDIVAMIVRIDGKSRTTDSLNSIIVWDGTTDGPYVDSAEDASTRSKSISSSINIAKQYSNCDSYDTVISPDMEEMVKNTLVNPCVGSLRGCTVMFRIVEDVNFTLSNICPGMWVRFRNLHVDTIDLSGAIDVPVAVIAIDTHVCPLLPYYK